MSKAESGELIYEGVALSYGVAVGRVCRFNEKRHNRFLHEYIPEREVPNEKERFREALTVALERIESVYGEATNKIGKAEAEIFTAQKMILHDEELVQAINSTIETDSCKAETAVMRVLDSYEKRLRELEAEYMTQRASDFNELKYRILDALLNINPDFQCGDLEHCQQGRGRIVVVEELTPLLTVELDTAHVLGFVTEKGGANSHAAIMARSLGIPAVSGIGSVHDVISCGTEVVVNGNKGEVVLWPEEETVSRIRKEAGEKVRVPHTVDPVEELQVMANISLAQEMEEAEEMKADGVGLYRTEFEFIVAGYQLCEEEQYERYAKVLEKMKGKTVTFRMIDTGGDKPLSFLDFPSEDNPALGWRGARFLLDSHELFDAQANALAKVAEKAPIRVMYPMVTGAWQFEKLKAKFLEATGSLNAENIEHGLMFEVPSACFEPDEVLKVADFGSIGSNDLIQYLFAVDRNNEFVSYDHNANYSVLWRIISGISEAGKRHGKDVSLCGEIAADPAYVGELIRAGIGAVSVNSRFIPGTRMAATEQSGP